MAADPHLLRRAPARRQRLRPSSDTVSSEASQRHPALAPLREEGQAGRQPRSGRTCLGHQCLALLGARRQEAAATLGPGRLCRVNHRIAQVSGAVEAALAYCRRGWSIVPMQSHDDGGCSCGRRGCVAVAKHPRVSWEARMEVAATEKEVEEWWRRWPDANVGTVTAGPDAGTSMGSEWAAALVSRVPARARGTQKPNRIKASGRVAQWESARFTRERSQVRNPPRPLAV
jgi:bifunctional DNA primase/polymerase-like protein